MTEVAAVSRQDVVARVVLAVGQRVEVVSWGARPCAGRRSAVPRRRSRARRRAGEGVAFAGMYEATVARCTDRVLGASSVA